MSSFTSPPNPHAFNALVWDLVRQISAGKIATYGQIGALITPPNEMPLKDYDAFRARWVGGAMAACPDDVPWWRVINAQGKISLRPGAEEQRQLLEAEGVEFDQRGRVDLKTYKWQSPDKFF